MEGDIAAGEDRDIGAALDDQVEPGHGTDLRLHRRTERIAIEQPARRDQGDQRRTEQRHDRHREAPCSLGHRQRKILVISKFEVAGSLPKSWAGSDIPDDPRQVSATCWFFLTLSRPMGGQYGTSLPPERERADRSLN